MYFIVLIDTELCIICKHILYLKMSSWLVATRIGKVTYIMPTSLKCNHHYLKGKKHVFLSNNDGKFFVNLKEFILNL